MSVLNQKGTQRLSTSQHSIDTGHMETLNWRYQSVFSFFEILNEEVPHLSYVHKIKKTISLVTINGII